MRSRSRFDASADFAKKMDAKDPLAKFRDKFCIPKDSIYVDGNSLGLCPKDSEKNVLRTLEEWKTLAIKGFMLADPPWFYMGERLGALCAELVGAEPDEVVCTGTTTVNIHALLATFYRPEGKRIKLLADELDFPSDIYAMKSQIALRGLDPEKCLVRAPSVDGYVLDEETVIKCMTDEVALIMLPSVLYRSGQLLDIERLTEEAHKRGITIGFDCCHSVGAVPHRFDEWGVDFAMWCSYKYMNCGPGSTAFLYVNKKHFDKGPALAGWFGNRKETQFDMSHDFEPARTAGAWQISSPAIFSAAPAEGALDLIREAGIENIRKKSIDMTNYLIYLIDEILCKPPYDFSIGTPRDPARRGGHVAIVHKNEAVRINEALLAKGVVPDFRPPDIIRVAPVALYNTYYEIWQVVRYLKEIIDNKEYERFPKARKAVA